MKTLLSILTLLLISNQLHADTASSDAEAAGTPSASITTSYLLSPFDQVSVSVYDEPDLTSQQSISDQGTLSIPLLGEIQIGNLSISDAQKHIQNSLIEARYLVKPVVTINVVKFAPKKVTVIGEVNKPGSIEIPLGQNSIPIQTLIAEAGGFTGAAQKAAVRVTRPATAEGQRDSKHEVNVGSILNGKDDTIFLVRPNDIIFIPRRLF